MTEAFMDLAPWQQALAGTIFTYLMTAAGAALVFFFKSIDKNILNLMLGFAAGVMIAASFWSLLDPAIAQAEKNGDIAWLVVALGFGAGGLFLYAADLVLPHLTAKKGDSGRTVSVVFTPDDFTRLFNHLA
ncbi:hypothetical protein IV38_GL000952 [Lactobacillus selangorensis]|uniref:ZIP family metal transporter n=1 Tax=Lactobacillus selangorensis TaxID=81857 RepID=A0A0R2FM12_9LACO|nr:hypothetical protein IV38_GL000952 [Lactobacillus selangorensis]KRN32843.1 hypothetical protein IV40_GL000901 [Lactobacillus selangorensis]